MVTKNQRIPLVALRIEPEQASYWSVYFSRPIGFDFEPGDWIDITFEGMALKGGITYSLSSSPTEAELRITFREGVSEFKRALQQILPGSRLTISQYGNDYDFQLKRNQTSLLIAGGVGVAPFRSMLKEMYDNDYTNEVTLIFLNQNENFLFKNELDEWANYLPGLKIVYVVTKDMNRKKREKLIVSFIKDLNQNFYISGPPAMVEANEHLLIDTGVQVRDIRIDSFGGY